VAGAALKRAAALSAEAQRKTERLITAAEVAYELGLADAVRRLLDQVEALDLDALETARVEWLREMVTGTVWYESGAARTFVRIAQQMRDGGDVDMALRSLVPIAHRTWWTQTQTRTRQYLVDTGPLLDKFPDVTVFAAPGTIEVMQYHASPAVRAAVWDKQFPDQIPAVSVVAPTPRDNAFELEGEQLRIVEVGHTDTDKTTVLHVPSIGLVVAGDAVYNGVHQYLVETGNGGIHQWLEALDTIAALQPRKVVASHKNPALDDDPKAIDETRSYLQDAERLSRTSQSALEFYNAMLDLYPERLNPSALWFWGAQVLFPAAVR
jgi:glyoxylase-like metal-dependent hydrolase (beta-lactamase superfamily II)